MRHNVKKYLHTYIWGAGTAVWAFLLVVLWGEPASWISAATMRFALAISTALIALRAWLDASE